MQPMPVLPQRGDAPCGGSSAAAFVGIDIGLAPPPPPPAVTFRFRAFAAKAHVVDLLRAHDRLGLRRIPVR